MTGSNASFNLIDSPWISVVYRDGTAKDVSLHTFFVDASEISQISGDIPQQTAPILRLALAILYRAYYGNVDEQITDEDKEQDWIDAWDQRHFKIDVINDYLETFHHRFNLLDPQYPFFQVPSLTYQTDKDYDPVGEIIADVPKPEKFLFSLRGKGTIEDISLAEAARWLVYLQSYDTAGIKTPVEGNTHVNKGKVYPPKGVVSTGWMGSLGGVFLEGSTLFETLLFNWCLISKRAKASIVGNEEDKPAWERAVPGFDIVIKAGPEGPADLFTWQDRRIRLVTNDAGDRIVGIVSCYGDVLTAYNKHAFETMTVWRESDAQKKKLGLSEPPLMPVTLDSSKALWQGLQPILMKSRGTDEDLRPEVIRWMERMKDELAQRGNPLPEVTIHAQGIAYGTQSSVVDNAIDDSLNINASLLRHDAPAVAKVVDVVATTEKGVLELVKLARRVEQAAGDKRDKNQSTQINADIRELAYGELDALFRERIADFSEEEDPEDYAESWLREVRAIIKRIGAQFIADSSGSSFSYQKVEKIPYMTASRADLLFQSGLKKCFG